jgi:hypothetical protein
VNSRTVLNRPDGLVELSDALVLIAILLIDSTGGFNVWFGLIL